MPTVEERLAFLEGRVEEQTRTTDGIRNALASLEARMDRRFEAVDARITAFEDKVDRRFEAVDARFVALDEKMDRRFDGVDSKIGRLTAIVVTAMAAVLAVMGGLVAALLRAS